MFTCIDIFEIYFLSKPKSPMPKPTNKTPLILLNQAARLGRANHDLRVLAKYAYAMRVTNERNIKVKVRMKNWGKIGAFISINRGKSAVKKIIGFGFVTQTKYAFLKIPKSSFLLFFSLHVSLQRHCPGF